jgi:tyrosine-protein kinase Etk/Wzc
MNTPQPFPTNLTRKHTDDIDLRKYLFLFIENWYWFTLTIFLGLGLALFVNKYSIKEYKVNATLLIEDEKNQANSFGSGGQKEGTDFLSGFGLYPSMKNLQNQTLILQSYSKIGKTIHETDFEVTYFKKELIGKREIYNESPFIISFDRSHTQPLGVLFTVTVQSKGKLNISAEAINETVENYDYLTEKVKSTASSFNFKKDVEYGIPLQGENYLFSVLPREGALQPVNGSSQTYFFLFNNIQGLISTWRSRLVITPMKASASMVELSINTDCPSKAITFLDTHLETYRQRTLDKKNQFAIKTIEFIDKQLVSISDSLGQKEKDLQNFRKNNQVVDVSYQAQQLFEQTKEMENTRGELKLKGDYYIYLKRYLSENMEAGDLVAPSVMGISDPLMNNLVLELNRMENEKVAMKGDEGSRNPYLRTLDSQIKNAKVAFEETLINMEKNNNIAISDVDARLERVLAEVRKLPQKERDLFGIERQFKLNDYLYTYLLQRRSEAQIAKASNTPDNEIIDTASVAGRPIKPKTRLNYLLGFLIGLTLPGLFFMAKELLNIKIETEDEVRRITNLPLAGHISHNTKDYPGVVLNDPQSNISEAFRNLRTRMRFFTREVKSPAILITSSMPSEGKTFTALNLASAYSLAGSKTVLVSFDLRRPRIYSEFGLDNETGISTYLIGRDKIDDIIMKTGHENLFIIPAGPVPPNPSELILTDKTKELYTELRKRFDIIVTDSAPIGAVSDTYSLASLSDAIIMLVRHNKTVKQLLKDTMEDCKANGLTNMSILMNDIRSDMRMYGYRGRYGYVYGYEYSYHSKEKK